MAFGDWFDTGRTMEYVYTGSLTIHPEVAGAAVGVSVGAAGGAGLGAAAFSAEFRSDGTHLILPDGTDVTSVPWDRSYTLTYTQTVRTREQMRYGNIAAADEEPRWACEFREVLEPSGQGDGSGYVHLSWSLDYNSLSGSLFMPGASEDMILSPEDELRKHTLSVSAENILMVGQELRLLASATAGDSGFLTGDYRDASRTYSSQFLSNGVELYGSGVYPPTASSGNAISVLGPRVSVRTRVWVRRWTEAYSYARIVLPWVDQNGIAVRVTADNLGLAEHSATGRYRYINGSGMSAGVEETSPLAVLYPLGEDPRPYSVTLDPDWVISQREHGYAIQTVPETGERWTTRLVDGPILMGDQAIQASWSPFMLTKWGEQIIDDCETSGGWVGINESSVSDDPINYVQGEASVQVSVPAGTGGMEQSWAPDSIISRHFRYLQFYVRPATDATELGIYLEGQYERFAPENVQPDWTLSGPLHVTETGAYSRTIPMTESDNPGCRVSYVGDGWYRVVLDLSANPSAPGWGRLMDCMTLIRFSMTAGTWNVDEIKFLTGNLRPARMSVMLEDTRVEDGREWDWTDGETSGSVLTAKICSCQTVIISTDGIRVMTYPAVIRRETIDGQISYQMRTLADLKNYLSSISAGGWDYLGGAAPTHFEDDLMWLGQLGDWTHQEGQWVAATLVPRFHEVYGLYARGDWHFQGWRVLQSAAEGLVYDESTQAPLVGAYVDVRLVSDYPRELPHGQTAPVDVTLGTAMTDNQGWYYYWPIPHSDHIENLPLDSPEGEHISIDTRYDVRVRQSGAEVATLADALELAHREDQEAIVTGIAPGPVQWILKCWPDRDKLVARASGTALVAGPRRGTP